MMIIIVMFVLFSEWLDALVCSLRSFAAVGLEYIGRERKIKKWLKKRIIIEVAVHQIGVLGGLGKGAVVYLISNSRRKSCFNLL